MDKMKENKQLTMKEKGNRSSSHYRNNSEFDLETLNVVHNRPMSWCLHLHHQVPRPNPFSRPTKPILFQQNPM